MYPNLYLWHVHRCMADSKISCYGMVAWKGCLSLEQVSFSVGRQLILRDEVYEEMWGSVTVHKESK